MQPTDTVYDLAASSGTTIEEIQRVNCLADPSLIYDGQVLYIPGAAAVAPTTAVPAPTTAAPAPTTVVPASTTVLTAVPTVTPTPASPTAVPCRAFNCPPDAQLPPLELPVGGPNDPTVIPCQFPRFEGNEPTPIPYIGVDTGAKYVVEIGQRRYFYLCDFPTGPITATVTLSDGSIQTVGLLSFVPNPDLPSSPKDSQDQPRLKAVIDWPALPTQPLGDYMLRVGYADGKQLEQVFSVDPPTRQYILPVPAAGPPGTTFDIYYVNFTVNMTRETELYGEDSSPAPGQNHRFWFRDRSQVVIAHAFTQPMPGLEGQGWEMISLEAKPEATRALYAITHDRQRVSNFIWLR